MEKLPKLLETLLGYFARGNQQRNQILRRSETIMEASLKRMVV